MTIQRVKRRNVFRNNLHKLILTLFIFFSSFVAFGQNDKKPSSRKLKKVGFLYNSAKQNVFLLSDNDYDYKTNVFKFQLFYHLKKWGKWNLNLIVQPQFQIAKHQLLNEFFVKDNEPNYEFLREKFTQKKTLSLYAFELGFQFKRKFLEKLFFEATLGLGAGYIDVETERLAQGFTFIENLSVGFSYLVKNSEIYLGSNLGHVSNSDIQLPNSGYNVLGLEIGYRLYIR